MNLLKYLFVGIILSFSVTSCNTLGCMDETASNYNEKATEDDGECVYNMGCTDETALNYDANAVKDDGNCKYDTTGQVMFWTDGKFSGSSIEITITRKIESSITGSAEFKEELYLNKYLDAEPECAKTGNGTLIAAPGTYQYTAVSSTDSRENWSGEVTVTLGQCKKVLLEHIPEIKYTASYSSYKGGTDNNEIWVVNKCSAEYLVYAYTIAGYDIDVSGNSSARSPKLRDTGSWKIRISKKSQDKGSGNCAGFRTEEITGVNFQNGLVYKIVIGE